jgi:HEAT repeat protein
VRALAALSLGLLGDRRGVDTLLLSLDSDTGGNIDPKSCAVVALGLFATDPDAVVRNLLGIIEDQKLDRRVRAHAPTSIARLGPAGHAAIPTLLQILTSAKTDNDMLRSCVIALGKLASIDQQDVVDALRAVAIDCSDSQSRLFAHIALGEIAGREDNHEAKPPSAAQRTVLEFLMQQVVQSKSTLVRSWASLALAIDARSASSRQLLAIPVLRRAFADAKDPSLKAAVAIALGIAGATDAADTLLREFVNSGDAILKGYLGVALGLLNVHEAAEPMLDVIRRKGVDSRARLNLVRGLKVMNDPMTASVVIDELTRVSSLSETGVLVAALGLLPDRAGIEPLKGILGDPSRDAALRGLAAVSLGRIAAKTLLPVHSRLSIGINYRALTTSLAEAIDVL